MTMQYRPRQTALTLDYIFDHWVLPVPHSGCWIWMRSLDDAGYGQTWREGQPEKAHRCVWSLAHNKPVPDDLCVLHKCDIKCCVNPDHLFLGTQWDNIDDMFQKCRGYKQKTARAILTESDVLEILASAERADVLAKRFLVKPNAVSAIKNGRRWGWLTGLKRPPNQSGRMR